VGLKGCRLRGKATSGGEGSLKEHSWFGLARKTAVQEKKEIVRKRKKVGCPDAIAAPHQRNVYNSDAGSVVKAGGRRIMTGVLEKTVSHHELSEGWKRLCHR